ncbi:hypothetical protein CDAR_464511 [Caerostris darwini]|uniref:Uncharacterized protein n=1 Tax=Caerostris darwini TaxID=1538125 RepID=A0AAV4VUU3_9ARAC|nr:hypothetical protein CDAR_464511 [Caerostris darwini]
MLHDPTAMLPGHSIFLVNFKHTPSKSKIQRTVNNSTYNEGVTHNPFALFSGKFTKSQPCCLILMLQFQSLAAVDVYDKNVVKRLRLHTCF